MTPDADFDYRRLSVAQRLQLVEAIWDSIAEDAGLEALPLTTAEQALLDERLADLDAHPDTGGSWPDARKRILDRSA